MLDLKDHERGLVWIDGRFSRVLRSGPVRLVDGPEATCGSKCSTPARHVSSTTSCR